MGKSMEEYAYLRSEIISLEASQKNVWVYMYVLFSSLFVLGLQFSYYFFLVTYIILIPFQCVINDFWWSISRIATYIRLFYEEDSEYIKWESFQINPLYIEYCKKKNRNLMDIIRRSGSVHLAILSTIFFCKSILSNNYMENSYVICVKDFCLLIFSMFLLLVTIYINKEYSGKCHNDVEDIMIKYKKMVIGEGKKK